MSRTNFNYISCMKIYGVRLLPPVIDDELSKELKKYKERAIAIEHELSLRRISRSAASTGKGSPQDIREDELSSPNKTLDECSDASIKFIEYIKHALRNAPIESSSKNQPQQYLSDSNILDICKTVAQHIQKTSSSDTLHNLETFGTEDGKSRKVDNQVENHSNTSSDAETLSPENIGSPDNLTLQDKISPGDKSQEPKTPIRRKSFTLDSPSPALIRYFQSLAKDMNSENSENMSEISMRAKSSKNLNEIWGNDTSYIDMSKMTQKSPSLPTSPKSINVSDRLSHHNQNNNVHSVQNGTDEQSNKSNSTPNGVYSSPKRNNPFFNKMYTSDEENAAKKIQGGIRGYLVRRLLRTNKIIDLKKIICDSVVCAKKLHMEESVTQADVTLHVRLIRQVTAACFELHSIFFEWPIKEQMALIRQDRLMVIRALNRKRLSLTDVMSKSEMKMSPVSGHLSNSPHSGSVSHGSIMSASFPQDTTSPSYLRQRKGCPTLS